MCDFDFCGNSNPHTSHKLPYSCRKAIGEQLRYIELAMKRLDALKVQVQDWAKLFPGCCIGGWK